MFRLLIKVLIVCLITFQIINCLQNDDNTNESKSLESLNSTSTDEDYEESEEDEEEEESPPQMTFFEKFRDIHSKNKNATINLNVNHINETFELINNFQKRWDHLFKSDGRIGLEFIEFISEIDVRISPKCSSSLFKIYSGVKSSEIWALKFLDSMGRFPPPGILEGVQSSFGEFDECLDIKSTKTGDNGVNDFNGKYCILNTKMPFPSMSSFTVGEPLSKQTDLRTKLMEKYGLIKLSSVKSMIETLNLSNGTIYRLGICIPSVCTPEEIEDTLNKMLYPVTGFPLEIERKCHLKEQKLSLDKYEWSSLVIITSLTSIVIISTGIEVIINRRKESVPESDSTEFTTNQSKNVSLLVSFSLLKNTRKLFAKNEKFGALDTIRLLMIIHIHFGHIYQYASSIGLPAMKKILSDVLIKVYEDNSMVFARTPLPVDVLFTLSGFLLSYGLLRKLNKTKGRFDYMLFLFQRYIRFLVLVFGSILFFYLYPLSGDGPIWEEGVRKIIIGCKNPSNLINNLFFINNFNNEGNNFNDVKCHPVTWFLAALLQLTAIAPIFVIIYFKKPILGIYLIMSSIILSLFIAISPQLLFGIPPYLRIWELDSVIFSNSRSLAYYHTYPTVYLVSFLVGFPFGFMLIKKVRFTTFQECLFWVSSVVSIVTVYFWHNSFWHLDESAPLISVLLWHTIGKLTFGLGFGWIFYACCTGRAGYLNSILSWNGFQPIARLSFGIYLLHNLVVSHRVFSVKNTYEMSFKYMLEHTLVDILYDIILAFIFYILIECPFSNLFDTIFNSTSKKTTEFLDENHKKNNNNIPVIKSIIFYKL